MKIKEVYIEENIKYLYENKIEKELALNGGMIYSLRPELERGWGPQNFLLASFEDEEENVFSFVLAEGQDLLLIKKNEEVVKKVTDFEEFSQKEGMDGEFNMIELIHKLFFPKLEKIKYESIEEYKNAQIKEDELPF